MQASKPEKPPTRMDSALIPVDLNGTLTQQFLDLLQLIKEEVEGLDQTPQLIRTTLEKVFHIAGFFLGAEAAKDTPDAKCAVLIDSHTVMSDAKEAFAGLEPALKHNSRKWSLLRDKVQVHLVRAQVLMAQTENIIDRIPLTDDSERQFRTIWDFLKRDVKTALEDITKLAENYTKGFKHTREIKFMEFRQELGDKTYNSYITDPVSNAQIVINGRPQTRIAQLGPRIDTLSQMIAHHKLVMEAGLVGLGETIPNIATLFTSLDDSVKYHNPGSPKHGPAITVDILTALILSPLDEAPITAGRSTKNTNFIISDASGTGYDPTNPNAVIPFDVTDIQAATTVVTSANLLDQLTNSKTTPAIKPPVHPAPHNYNRSIFKPVAPATVVVSQIPTTNTATMPYGKPPNPEAARVTGAAMATAKATQEEKAKAAQEATRAKEEEKRAKEEAKKAKEGGAKPVRVHGTRRNKRDRSPESLSDLPSIPKLHKPV